MSIGIKRSCVFLAFFWVIPFSVRADETPPAADPEQKLALTLQSSISQSDIPTAQGLMDTDALFQLLSKGVEASPEFVTGVKKGFSGQSQAFMSAIAKAAGPDGYHFLRIQHLGGETHILFRLATDAGVNYHDWIVGKDASGKLRLDDVYVALSGERMSQTLHRLYLQAALQANPGLLDRLTGRDKQMGHDLNGLLQLMQDNQNQNFDAVLSDYKNLSPAMQQEKCCLVVRLAAAERLRDQVPAEYSNAMVDYKRLFPNDPAIDLATTDLLLEQKKFAEARAAIDRIDAMVGGDPYLNILRGGVYKQEGGAVNLQRAKKYFQRAVDEEPTLADGYWSEVTLSLDTHQYEDTAYWLTQIEQKLQLHINDLAKFQEYSGFVKSAAYKKWMATRAESDAATTKP